jgi:hypothetical protein
MITELVETLKKEYSGRSTQELLALWQTKGTWDENLTEEAFEAIHQILVERGIDAPTQTPAGQTNDAGLSSTLVTETVGDIADLMTQSGWSYGTARGIARVISFAGWLFVGLCAVAAVISIFGGMGVIAMVPVLIGLIGGFFMVAAGQVLRATVDNADNTGQMLALMKTWVLENKTPVNGNPKT